ncbi:MAG: hypothetical protein K6G26_03080 [Lachnospiraceae bacterium]|nr:hypothetical protein [Lachnospiraceae bacterium]
MSFYGNKLQDEREAKKQKKEMVKEILAGIDQKYETKAGKIKLLLDLHEILEEKGYTSHEKLVDAERKATTLWISILTQSMFSEYITQGQMLSLVEDDILEEWDISNLLNEKYNDHRDYEWYSEDFLGCDQSDETILRIDDILEIAEPQFKELLGIAI